MDIKDYIFNLYEIHSSDLIEVRKKQREFIQFFTSFLNKVISKSLKLNSV